MKSLINDTQGRLLLSSSLNFIRVLLLVLALLCCVSCNDKEAPLGRSLSPKALEPAPDFELIGLDGKKHRLSEHKGKVVFLNFWATWCTPCVLEMPSIERLHKSLKDKGLVVVTVNADEPGSDEKVKKFAESYGLNFTILRDPKYTTSDLFGVSGFPETFIINRDGKFISFKDPATESELVRIISDRPWDSVKYLKELESLL